MAPFGFVLFCIGSHAPVTSDAHVAACSSNSSWTSLVRVLAGMSEGGYIQKVGGARGRCQNRLTVSHCTGYRNIGLVSSHTEIMLATCCTPNWDNRGADPIHREYNIHIDDTARCCLLAISFIHPLRVPYPRGRFLREKNIRL